MYICICRCWYRMAKGNGSLWSTIGAGTPIRGACQSIYFVSFRSGEVRLSASLIPSLFLYFSFSLHFMHLWSARHCWDPRVRGLRRSLVLVLAITTNVWIPQQGDCKVHRSLCDMKLFSIEDYLSLSLSLNLFADARESYNKSSWNYWKHCCLLLQYNLTEAIYKPWIHRWMMM